eukprot:jgi/Mesvir1/3355/Mv06741-RA.1
MEALCAVSPASVVTSRASCSVAKAAASKNAPAVPRLGGSRKLSQATFQGLRRQGSLLGNVAALPPSLPRSRLVSARAEAKLSQAEAELLRESEAALAALKAENDQLRRLLPSPFAADAERARNYKPTPVEGDGLAVIAQDQYLNNHRGHLQYRYDQYKRMRADIDKYEGGLEKFSRGYETFGFTKSHDGITYREWAPGARAACLIGDFNNWNPSADPMTKNQFGVFELRLPNNPDGSPAIPHDSKVKVRFQVADGSWVDRIPAYIQRACQPPNQVLYDGHFWNPETPYRWVNPRPPRPRCLRIYECHVGMSSKEPKVNTYREFQEDVLPRIKKLGYNTIQVMAIQEHAYYASFGYHVTSFFAPSSRCGTPDELKAMIDAAHGMGIFVLMDVVHSHASSNVLDGLNNFDGTDSHYFHSPPRGYHWMWDSRLFNYGSWEVLRFLLSNLRWWVEEFKFDGYRFDGVTSMMYLHHGLQMAFTGDYGEYFGPQTDVEAMVYLMLANEMLHELYPDVVTIAEDVSGMPTLCRPVAEGGVGFDYRLNMAIADKWIEFFSECSDEQWDMGNLVFTLTNRRYNEKCIAYAESHDQALVGDKTIAFWLMDKDMYDYMSDLAPASAVVERGIALHKMVRLITMALGGNGYLNFMGNEFGHPEWIDFPRVDSRDPSKGTFVPGNGGSFDKCRRRWDLADADYLRYKYMNNFDIMMNKLEEAYGFMTAPHEYVSRKNEGDKVIVFERGDLVFVFNFHWNQSFTDYRIGCLKPGKYRIVLDSDRPEFGGFSRVNPDTTFFADNMSQDNRPASFMVYTPNRSVQVYAPADLADPLEAFCATQPDSDECRVYDD